VHAQGFNEGALANTGTACDSETDALAGMRQAMVEDVSGYFLMDRIFTFDERQGSAERRSVTLPKSLKELFRIILWTRSGLEFWVFHEGELIIRQLREEVRPGLLCNIAAQGLERIASSRRVHNVKRVTFHVEQVKNISRHALLEGGRGV
jgi:hypothetical protein